MEEKVLCLKCGKQLQDGELLFYLPSCDNCTVGKERNELIEEKQDLSIAINNYLENIKYLTEENEDLKTDLRRLNDEIEELKHEITRLENEQANQESSSTD